MVAGLPNLSNQIDAHLLLTQEINNKSAKLGTTSISTIHVPHRKESAMRSMSTDVFSVFIFENECPGAWWSVFTLFLCKEVQNTCREFNRTLWTEFDHCTDVWYAGELEGLQKKIYIEPLVGHMRHPYALEPCSSSQTRVSVRPHYHLQAIDYQIVRWYKDKSRCLKPLFLQTIDMSYLFLNPWPAPDFQLLYPGKKWVSQIFCFILAQSRHSEHMTFENHDLLARTSSCS